MAGSKAPEPEARRTRTKGDSLRRDAPSNGTAQEGPQRAGTWPAPVSWRDALRAPRAGPPDYWLLAVVGAIVVLGLVMLYSASFARSAWEKDGNSMFYLGRQLLWVLVGLAGGAVMMRVDYRFWRRFSVPGMVVVVVLLVALLILPATLVPPVQGARRWFFFGSVGVQPSQLTYLVFVVYIADWLSKRGQRLHQVAYGLVPFAVVLGLLAGLIVLEPDMGTAIVLVLVGAVVFLVAGADLKQFSLAALLSGALFFLLTRFSAYRWARMVALLHPFANYSTVSYHQAHNQMAMGTGGLFGIGLGQGRHKFFWLPSPHTDSIYAVVGEELGLLGCLLMVALFLWVAYRGYTIAIRAPDRYGLLLGVGATTWISAQAFLNMTVVAGLLPFTGVTLPFVSYGGSSLACCMTAVGLLLNLSSYEKRDHAPIDLWWGNRRPRLPGTGRRRRPSAEQPDPVRGQ